MTELGSSVPPDPGSPRPPRRPTGSSREGIPHDSPPDAEDSDPSNLLGLYFREIKDDDLLTAAEERALAGAIARGDRGARARMMVEPPPRRQDRPRLRGPRPRLDDLVGEGNLGLLRAANEYDPRFGTRFSTYASYWIKQAIRHALTNTAATIRLPSHMVGLLSKWRKVERALCRESASPPPEQIADALGLSPAQRDMVDRAPGPPPPPRGGRGRRGPGPPRSSPTAHAKPADRRGRRERRRAAWPAWTTASGRW